MFNYQLYNFNSKNNQNIVQQEIRNRGDYFDYEMVRLGEFSENCRNQFLLLINVLSKNQQNGNQKYILDRKGDSGMNFINETNERIERRVMALLALGEKDQLKFTNRLIELIWLIREYRKNLKLCYDQFNKIILKDWILEQLKSLIELLWNMKKMKQAWTLKDQINMERLQYETVNQILVNIQNEEAKRYSHVIMRGFIKNIRKYQIGQQIIQNTLSLKIRLRWLMEHYKLKLNNQRKIEQKKQKDYHYLQAIKHLARNIKKLK
ncbi:unnamed protein product [Paramecium sonneborni]|uniref:Uncharacterized protein n=1 Tax=Paramecium sonneborni TaxID=65129 RepID=A0A8S1RSL8_9CILI|nr:unnamed protein product [Paramecium sonneborni]